MHRLYDAAASPGSRLRSPSSLAISYPISCIINLSVGSRIVPGNLKIARVIPLFKSGEQSIFTNYRPLSILPAFSKILQKVTYNRFIAFFHKHNILSDNQYHFCKHHSSAYALTHLYDKVATAIDNKEYILLPFLSTCRKPLILLIIAFYLKHLNIWRSGLSLEMICQLS